VPLSELIQCLVSHKFRVVCFGDIQNIEKIENMGATFVSYPELQTVDHSLILSDIDKKFVVATKSYRFEESYYFLLKKGAIKKHYITEEEISVLTEYVKKISPSFIFHDVVDLYAPIICERLGITRIDYITNNLYNRSFFDCDPVFLNALMVRGVHLIGILGEEYFKNFWEKEREIYNDVHNELSCTPVPELTQFNMNGELNLIFSSEILQPESSIIDKKRYITFSPTLDRFAIENDISDSLKEFISNNKNREIIYIAHGSYLNEGADYYKLLLSWIKENDIVAIISCGKSLNLVKDLINVLDLNKLVYTDSFLPQKYILSKSDLFITTGGINSVMESIYFSVPMIINPVSAEQRMNGYLIEKLNLGMSQFNTKNRSLDEVFKLVMDNNKKIIDNMKNYSNRIINNNDDKLEGLMKSLKKLSNE